MVFLSFFLFSFFETLFALSFIEICRKFRVSGMVLITIEGNFVRRSKDEIVIIFNRFIVSLFCE